MKSKVFAVVRALAAALAIVAWSPPVVTSVARAEDPAAHAEKAEAGHEAPGHGDAHGEPNPLAIDVDLAVYTLLVFVVLLVVLKKFAWGPIAAALDLREQKIADQIAAAESANDEAKRMLAQYEAKLAKAAEEVRGILDEARRDAEHTQQDILAKARADAGTEMDRAKREIGTAKDQALKELAETSANLAVDLAGRIVRAKLTVQDHARLIEDAMASFPKGDHRGN